VSRVFERFGVLSTRELGSRRAAYTEQYRTQMLIEARCLAALCEEHVIPSAIKSATRFYGINRPLNTAGQALPTLAGRAETLLGTAESLAKLVDRLRDAATLADGPGHGEEHTSSQPLPKIVQTVVPIMNDARTLADLIESRCAATDWDLPRYRDML
jgi:glutamine synthetase